VPSKAQLTFGLAGTDEPSHAINDWQRRLAENCEADCRDRLQAAEKENYLVGSPRPEDLRSAKYRLIIAPYITAQGVGSSIHAIERGPAPVQKLHSPYAQ
jgi:hypothetical protein